MQYFASQHNPVIGSFHYVPDVTNTVRKEILMYILTWEQLLNIV